MEIQRYDKTLLQSCKKRKCVHYAIITDTCDYFLDTGQRRAAVCKPGKDCTLYKKGVKEKQPIEYGKLGG